MFIVAMTAYSPSVIALNDMLRQQLDLTTEFVSSLKHMHRSYVSDLEPSTYQYTTLQDTKEVMLKSS